MNYLDFFLIIQKKNKEPKIIKFDTFVDLSGYAVKHNIASYEIQLISENVYFYHD